MLIHSYVVLWLNDLIFSFQSHWMMEQSLFYVVFELQPSKKAFLKKTAKCLSYGKVHILLADKTSTPLNYAVRFYDGAFNTFSLTISTDYSHPNNNHVMEGSTDYLTLLHLLMIYYP